MKKVFWFSMRMNSIKLIRQMNAELRRRFKIPLHIIQLTFLVPKHTFMLHHIYTTLVCIAFMIIFNNRATYFNDMQVRWLKQGLWHLCLVSTDSVCWLKRDQRIAEDCEMNRSENTKRKFQTSRVHSIFVLRGVGEGKCHRSFSFLAHGNAVESISFAVSVAAFGFRREYNFGLNEFCCCIIDTWCC